MNGYLWLLLAGGISFVWLGINKRLVGGFFSPFNLLLPFWVLPVLMCLLGLSSREPAWSPAALAMVIYYTVMLALVSLGIPLLFPERRDATVVGHFLRFTAVVRSRPFTICLLGVFAFALAAAFYNEILSNPDGVALLKFTADPSASRDASWHTKGEGRLWLLSVPVATLGPLVYLRMLLARRLSTKCVLFLLTACYPLIALFKMSRADLFTFCFSCVLVHYWWRRENLMLLARKRLTVATTSPGQRVLLVGVLATVILISGTIFQRIRSDTGSEGVTKFADLTAIQVNLPPPADALVSEMYMYFAIPFHNFARFVELYPLQASPGVGLIRPLYSAALHGDDAKLRLEEIDLDSYLRMLVNTWPIITWNYAEFGYVEVLVAPVIYAAVASGIYVRLRSRPGIIPLVLYCVVIAYQWVWMFSNNNFTGVQFFLYSLFILPFLFLYFLVRRVLFGKSVHARRGSIPALEPLL